MNLQELMERVFQDSGEPSDLSPYTTPGDETTFSIATTGAVKLIRQINTAAVRIANWKFRDGRILRPRSLRGRMYFNTQNPITGTVISATDSTVLFVGLATNVVDQFNGWLISTTAGTGSGQLRLITDTELSGTDCVLTVESDWDTNPDATTEFELYKSFFEFVRTVTYPYQSYHINLDPTLSLADIMRVRDVQGSTDLSRTYRDDTFTSTVKSTGTPNSFLLFGNELWFDVAPTENRSYEILYIKNPVLMTAPADIPELPEIYHEGLALWATHNIMRMNQDFNGAYATKKELEDLMSMLRLQGEFDMELDTSGLVVWG